MEITHKVKGFSILVLGNLALSFINILVYPVLTRIYSTEEFGEYGQFFIFTNLLGIICSGQLYLLIFQERFKRSAEVLSATLIFSTVTLTVVTGFIYFLTDSSFLYASLLFFGSLFWITTEAAKVYFNKNNQFPQTVALNFTSRMLTIFGRIFNKDYLSAPKGLILFEIIGNAAATVYFFVKIRFMPTFVNPLKFFKSILYNSSYTLLSFLVEEWPLIVMIKVFRLEELGVFFLFSRFLYKPAILFGNNLAAVLISELESNTYSKKLIKLIVVISGATIIGSSILFFYGTEIFSTLLGDDYARVGYYAKFLSIFVLVKFIKGSIRIKAAQTSRRKVAFAMRSIVILLYCVCTFAFRDQLIVLLIAIGTVEMIGEFSLFYLLVRENTSLAHEAHSE